MAEDIARPRRAKRDAALQRQNELMDARHALETRLVTLQAQNPDVSFPLCGCAS